MSTTAYGKIAAVPATKTEFGTREVLISRFIHKFNKLEEALGAKSDDLTTSRSFTLERAKCSLYKINEAYLNSKVEDYVFRENFPGAVSLLMTIGFIDLQHGEAQAVRRLFDAPMLRRETDDPSRN